MLVRACRGWSAGLVFFGAAAEMPAVWGGKAARGKVRVSAGLDATLCSWGHGQFPAAPWVSSAQREARGVQDYLCLTPESMLLIVGPQQWSEAAFKVSKDSYLTPPPPTHPQTPSLGFTLQPNFASCYCQSSLSLVLNCLTPHQLSPEIL